MLFYIQMAVVSTAIFFLFSPSFSFFLEIKVQIYIYIYSTINANTSTNSLQNLKFTELRRNQYPPPHVPRVITPSIPSNATKIGNPTSQCAQLDQFQAHKSTLAGRISYFNGIWVYLHTWGCAYQDAYVLGEGHLLQGVYLHSWGCAYLDTCELGEGYQLQGVYLHSWGCAYLDACILGEGHQLQEVYLHSWGCAYQDAYLATTSQKYLVT